MSCFECDAETVPHDRLFGAARINTYSTDEEFRRKELPKQLGRLITGEWLCATHESARVNGRCDSCHRPYHEE